MGIKLIPSETDEKWPNLTPARYLGTPCSKCGCPVRSLSRNACVACNMAAAEAWRARNRARVNESTEAGLRRAWADPAKRAARMVRNEERRRAASHPIAKADRAAVIGLYRRAKEEGLTVDHIVPLNGDTVCGLHVSWNIQLIPLADNVSKGNKFDETLGLAPVER